MDLKMSQRKSSDNHISLSTGPCNDVQVDGRVRKRRADEDGGMPRKTRTCSNLLNPTERGEQSVEDTNIQRGKRKASVDAGPPKKKTRSSANTTKSRVTSPEHQRVEPKKRKASDDGEAPGKKQRCSNTSSTGSSSVGLDVSDGDDDVSHITEEEKIYAMSSSANTSRADFQNKYLELDLISTGGFGSVYRGFRKTDSLPVAIKHIPYKKVKHDHVICNGKVYNIIPEVAFMLKTAGLPGPTGQSAAVSLLDWYLLGQQLILVMERPYDSKDLLSYRQERSGPLEEREAKMILKQLVDAAIDMHSKGVFHRDIKSQNILVEADSGVPRVRMIDFGCSSFCTPLPFYSFSGTEAYAPPEWYDSKKYWARSTTVWQLGIVFYSLLRGHKPFHTHAFLQKKIHINKALSTEVKTLLKMCLTRNPMKRATLEELQLSPALRDLPQVW